MKRNYASGSQKRKKRKEEEDKKKQDTGFLFSLSKSVRKAENDVLLDTIALRKAFRNGDTIYKSSTNPQDQYSMDEGEEERSIKSVGSENSYFSHDVNPLNVGVKQIPYSSLKSAPQNSENGDENVELTHERRDIGEEENAAKFPIGRRDFDMLRCMLGRVYRPCWQI
ncbi:pro-MCH [Bufo gargarizans]|uniref:pro-MCH n=1 Tax=Bufo gargarizans TaxID=30331 RepID=UPI001CF5D410|nr:pro-MCH [Bufo gargarizans]